MRARLRESIGDKEGAIADYDRAVASDPKSPDIYFDRGNALEQMGRYEEAARDFSKIIELKPDYDHGYYRPSFLRRILGDLDGALDDAGKADPGCRGCAANRGLVLYQKGSRLDAHGDFKRAVEASPSFDMARVFLWACRSRLGERGPATDDLRKYVEKIDENRKDLYAMCGRFLVGALDQDKLLTAFKEDDERRVGVWVWIGTRHLVEGDSDAARAAFEKSAAFSDKPSFYSGMAQAELKALTGK